MAVRTFFWDTAPVPAKTGFLRRKKPSATGWRHGNVGDVFNRDLISHLYGAEAHNTDDSGNRILLIGSTAHRVRPGDVVAGVGTKGVAQPDADAVRVVGARGPLTVDALRDAGHDVTGLRFLGDPGLLIGEVFPRLKRVRPKPGNVLFVPHYRERERFTNTARYRVLDVDQAPRVFARQIAEAETVYSSSLHGVIFAHALGRPAALVAPRTAEPEIKYRDYFASVGLKWRTPGDIDEALREGKAVVPDHAAELVRGFDFPTAAELLGSGIAS